MKVSLLLAALAATVVSALPTSNTTLAASELKKRAACRSTTLTWIVKYDNGNIHANFLYFVIDYKNGQKPYWAAVSHYGEPYDGRNKICHDDGVWCVEFSGWAKEGGEQVTIYYANRQFFHSGPDYRRAPDPGYYPRVPFDYYDCIPW